MKKIKSTTAFLNDPETNEVLYKQSYIEYDENGKVLITEDWADETELTSKTVSRYSDKGNLIEEIIYSSEKEISDKTVYLRDDNDEIERVEREYGDGSKTIQIVEIDNEHKIRIYTTTDEEGEFDGKEIYKFNEQKNITEKIIYNFENIIEEHIQYEYDGEKIVLQTEFESDGKIFAIKKYVYDTNNNLTEVITTNTKGAIISRATYTYDSQNRITEQKISNSYVIKFSYDDEKNIKIEERFNKVDMLVQRTEYIYNEEQLLLEERTPLSLITYSYDFFEE